MKGIRRTIGTAREKKTPATHDILAQLPDACPDTLIGKRDRALLALGFAGAFRRSELCALEVADLVEVPDGLRVVIRRSKTDQTGEGQEVAIPRGYKLRPVEAVQTWLAAAEISSGPVFRAVARGGVGLRCRYGGRQRLEDREALRPPGRPGGGVLLRPQPALGLPDVSSRVRRQYLQDGGGLAAP